MCRLYRTVVAAMAVIALVGRFQVADFKGLGTWLLDYWWNIDSAVCIWCDEECEEKAQGYEDSVHDNAQSGW